MKKVFTLLLSSTMLLAFDSVTFASDVGKSKVTKTENVIQSHIDISVVSYELLSNDVYAYSAEHATSSIISVELLLALNGINLLATPDLYWCYNNGKALSTTKTARNQTFEKATAWESLGIPRQFIIEKKA